MAKLVAEGQKAPPFSLATDGGGKVSLADFAGKPSGPLFLPERRHARAARRKPSTSRPPPPKFKKLGISVVGVSKDTVAAHDKFKAKHKLKVTLASDPDGNVIELIWVVGREKHVWPQVHGNRPLNLSDR